MSLSIAGSRQEDLGITQSQEAQWEIRFEFLRFISNFESGDQQMEKVPRQRDLHAVVKIIQCGNNIYVQVQPRYASAQIDRPPGSIGHHAVVLVCFKKVNLRQTARKQGPSPRNGWKYQEKTKACHNYKYISDKCSRHRALGVWQLL